MSFYCKNPNWFEMFRLEARQCDYNLIHIKQDQAINDVFKSDQF